MPTTELGLKPSVQTGLKHFTPPHGIGAWGAGGTTYGLVIEVCLSFAILWSGTQHVGQQPPAQTSFMVTPSAYGQEIWWLLSASAFPTKYASQPSATW